MIGLESSMDAERWRKVEGLFHAALERDPDARHAFLDVACAGDADLRQQVELLLTKEEQAGSFLETPAMLDMTITQTANAAVPGRQLGPYRIESLLGAGGMGEVYRAHDSKLDRDVAIKTLPAEFARDSDRLARLRREARTLASLNHPNIAAIHGLEESDGMDFLVLELVEGETLRGPLPVATALDHARQVADALEAAHSQGVIHRDLKPANVKVTPEGRVKVLDFGLAKAIWGPDQNQDRLELMTLTGTESLAGHIVGTPGYMSPEQARGEAVDERTDIWAFGCLLYELLSGKRAFHGESNQDTIAAVLEREPDLKALPAKTPVNVRELLRRCLQKDAARRLHNIGEARRTIQEVQRGSKPWQVAAAVASVAILVIAVGLWMRGSARMSDRSQWVQLTKFPDSVTQPALSPDGRVLTFIRGDFFGQVYVKVLPEGDPVQLTRDDLPKRTPTFSPDGSRIAYTTLDSQFHWDTWVAPKLGGKPQLLLRNASGLVWTDPQRVLFSEIKAGIHMGIVAAEENRMGERDVYLPEYESAMAHQSYLSPDGKWVLLVEMDQDHLWLPCRLVPMDGSSRGRQVGPLGGECTFAAWSHDGKWMYFTANPGGVNHIWRQRFPDGRPEQITSGPTEEEGIAMAPDGRSFVTAVKLQSTSLWIHDANGERQISLEGNGTIPKFTPDGAKLCYLIVKEAPDKFIWRFLPANRKNQGELRIADLKSGRSEPLVRGIPTLDYDVSADGRQVVLWSTDREGKPRLWLAPLDRSSSPVQIPNVEGESPKFGPGGDIFFRHLEGTSTFVYRVHPDGTGLQKVIAAPVFILHGISPDGRWIYAFAQLPGNGPVSNQAFPMNGGPPIPFDRFTVLSWTLDARSLLYSGTQTYLVPLRPGESLPQVLLGGSHSEEEIARLPGARRIDEWGVAPGPSAEVYAFYRGTVQGNLYRVPIP